MTAAAAEVDVAVAVAVGAVAGWCGGEVGKKRAVDRVVPLGVDTCNTAEAEAAVAVAVAAAAVEGGCEWAVGDRVEAVGCKSGLRACECSYYKHMSHAVRAGQGRAGQGRGHGGARGDGAAHTLWSRQRLQAVWPHGQMMCGSDMI